MSDPKPSLPIIDISPFVSPTADSRPRAATLSALRTALLDHGFFYLTGYTAEDAEAIAAVLAQARTFFLEASADEKAALKRRDPGDAFGDGARGYQVIGENVTQGRRDWHEALDWYAPIQAGEGIEAAELPKPAAASGPRSPPYDLLHGVNLWPSTPPTFRSTFTTYVKRMRALGTAVLHAMGQALELDCPAVFADSVADSFWVMRAIGYPPLDSDLARSGGVSCGAHSDYGCLTLLAADDTPGALQVLDRRTDSWIDVPPQKGALVVNVGDMVELWTAGWVRSTLHRVVHTGNGFRVSVPFFLEPGWDVTVEPLPECAARVAKEGRQSEGKAVKYGDHLVAKVGGNFYSGGAKR